MKFELHDEVTAKIFDGKSMTKTIKGTIYGRCVQHGIEKFDVYHIDENNEMHLFQNLTGGGIELVRRPDREEIEQHMVGRISATALPISAPTVAYAGAA